MTPTNARGSARTLADVAAIRAWATAHGYDISNRGRLPLALTDAYRAAHH